MRAFILVLGLLSLGSGAQPEAPAREQAVAGPAALRATAGQPGKGKLLVASKSLLDPNFSRTVVFLIEYNEQGALGVIINRPTEAKLSDLVELEGAERLGEPIYWGGPVARGAMQLLLRAKEAPEGALPVFRDVYRSGSRELLERLLSDPDAVEHLRLYSGYAGWAPGQLEAEIARGGWRVMPGDPNLVFSRAPSTVWPELTRRATNLRARRQGLPPGDQVARLPGAR